MKSFKASGYHLGYTAGLQCEFSGTSAAAPHVAAVALLMSSLPDRPAPYVVRDRLLSREGPVQLNDPAIRQYGILNAAYALTGVSG